MIKLYPTRFFIVLTIICLVVVAASLSIGSSGSAIDLIPNLLTGELDKTQHQIIMELRLPRTLSAFLAGGLLGLSGVLMQVLLRNPLADPYILGISGGAATGALIAIAVHAESYLIDVSAFSGALLSMLLVYLLSSRDGLQRGKQLLLTGVILAAGWGALINLLLILSDSQDIHSMLFWLMGDLSTAEQPSIATGLVLVTALIISWSFARDLNLLTFGDLKAQSLGCNVKAVKRIALLISTLATATAVSIAGTVGFVGLIIPHAVRLMIGNNHRLVLPAAVLAGGTLLVLADLGARMLLTPQQLPVGIITALIGVPIFIYLLRQSAHD